MDEIKIQLIDLHGYSTGIKKKDQNSFVFYFNDYNYGQLVVTAERDCILYYHTMRDKEYHLKVAVKGLSFKKKNGDHITRNCLIVKEVKELGNKKEMFSL